jgi:hypothetical protein
MTILRKHKRKHFFPIGILSLVFFPLICFYAIDMKLRYDPHTMEINLPPRDLYGYLNERYEKSYNLSNRNNFTYFQFTGDEFVDSIKLLFFRDNIRAFAFRMGTANGVHVNFQRQAHYKTFVRVIDLLNVENITRFSIEGADVWIYPPSQTNISAEAMANLIQQYDVNACSATEQNVEDMHFASLGKLMDLPLLDKIEYQLPDDLNTPFTWTSFSIIFILFIMNVFRIRRFKRDLS